MPDKAHSGQQKSYRIFKTGNLMQELGYTGGGWLKRHSDEQPQAQKSRRERGYKGQEPETLR